MGKLLDQLGIADAMKGKVIHRPALEGGVQLVASGEAEIGFQQVSELLPVAGVDMIGPLPPKLQKITVFSAGIATVSKEQDAGKALITFLASPAARATMIRTGLEPIPAGTTN